MIFFLIKLLTVVLLCRPTSISCIGSRNILPALPFGPYTLFFKQIKSCGISQGNKIQPDLYLSHNPESKTTEIKGNITFSIPLDDTLFVEFNFAMKDANGNWKENTYMHKSPKACSTFRILMGAEWARVNNGLGINNTICPITPGIYTAPGLDTSIFLNTNIPKTFVYGTYKLRVLFSRFKEVHGLLLFRSTSISCIGSRSILSELPFGQYKLVFKQIKSCYVSSNDKTQYNLYLSHNPKSNKSEIKGNITYSIPIDDTLFLEARLALRDADGSWKENTFIHKSPKACSAFRFLMGAEWTRVMYGFGINNATCPIPPGTYKIAGLDTSIFVNTNIPKTFIYGTYKVRFYYSRNEEVYGCIICVVEFKRH